MLDANIGEGEGELVASRAQSPCPDQLVAIAIIRQFPDQIAPPSGDDAITFGVV